MGAFRFEPAASVPSPLAFTDAEAFAEALDFAFAFGAGFNALGRVRVIQLECERENSALATVNIMGPSSRHEVVQSDVVLAALHEEFS